MARKGKVAVSISADSSGLKRGVRDAEGDLGRLQRVGVSSSRGLSAGFKAAGGIIAGAAVADQIRETVQAAQDAQVAQAKVKTMLENVGLSWAKYGKHIDAVITQQSRLTGLDDEELAQSFANMVRTTKDVNEALKLNALAADVARTKGMDLAGAQSLIARVYNGSFNGLKRLGIAITPVTAAQDKLKESTKHATIEQTRAAKETDKVATRQQALAQLQKQFGGQAAAYGKTAAGTQDRFRVAVENLREKLGGALLPVLTKVTLKVTTFVEQMTDGTGAGGRFAAKLKDIADRIRPIAKFFADHPKLIAVAVGAWATYRIAAVAATAASRLKLIGMFTGLGPRAAAGGVVAGREFGGAAATSAGTTFNRRAPGRLARGGAWRAAGRTIGLAMAVEIAPQIIKKVNDALGIHEGGSGVKGFLDSVVASAGHLLPDTSDRGPLGKILFPKHKPKPKTVKPSAGSQAAPDNHPRAHGAVAHVAVARASAARAGGMYSAPELAELWIRAGGPPAVADTAAAIALAESGGNPSIVNSIGATGLWQIYNGSGEVPGAKDPMTNARMAVAKYHGAGNRFTPWTVYTGADTPGHAKTYTQFLGQSGHAGGGSAVSVSAITGGTRAPGRPRRPVRLTAGLVGRGGSKVSGSRLGTKLPAGSTDAYVTPDLPPGTIEALGGDPETNLTSRTMRRFQIGNRIAAIDAALRNPRHSLAYRQRLIAERGQLVTEAEGLAKPMAAPEGPTGIDAIPGASAYYGRLDREAAEAELTKDTGDDLDVAQRTLTARQATYAYMKSHGFSDTDIAGAARDVKSAQDTVDNISGAQQDNTDAIKALTDELKRQNDFAAGVANVSMGQLARGLADFISGQIVGTGYDSRAMTAGAGALARY